MKEWRSRLSKFVTGAADIRGAVEWIVEKKANLFGYQWVTGQTGSCPYEYLVNVQVKIPAGYSAGYSSSEAASLIVENILPSHPDVKWVAFWDDNLLFGAYDRRSADAFVADLAETSSAAPERKTFDRGLVIAGVIAVAAIFFVLKKI